jgi:outer membrane protease
MCCSSHFLFSETNDDPAEKESAYHFTADISMGMLYGTSFELVYRDRNTILSELRWDVKPLFYIGSSVEFSLRNPMERPGFYGKLGLKVGFPTQSGYLEDRDWLAADNGLSHFSKHTNITDSALLLDASYGISIPIKSTIIFTPLMNFHYMHYKWTGQDGYTQYAEETFPGSGIYESWNESLPKTNIYGPGIGYSQDWLILSLGMSLRYPFMEKFLIEGSFAFSPIILVFATDDHYRRETNGIQFKDKLIGGYLLEPALAFTFRFNQKMGLNLKASYRYIHDSKGYSNAYDNSNDALIGTSRAGVRYQVWDMGLTFRYRF